MRAFSIALILVFSSLPAFAQQKAPQQKAIEKPKYRTFDECAAAKRATGWNANDYSAWCAKNSGR